MSLAIVQGLNYILPLLTLPYLVRILGPEKYGLTAFSLAFIQFLVLITDYGFNLSATKEISIHREDEARVSRIFSSVISIKMVLLVLSFLILALVVSLVPKFREDSSIYYLTFTLVVGNAIFPLWFFQGIEKMKFITILNIISKSLYALSVFLLIKQQSDYGLVNFLNGLCMMLIGIISLIILYVKFGVRYKIPSKEELTYQLKEGWHVFLSTMAISLYTISNTFFLGIFTNNTIVGYYSGAEKVINAFNGLINPLAQTVYPHINRLAQNSKSQAIQFISKIFKVVGAGSLLCSIFIFFAADWIIQFLLGNGYEQSVVILKILSLLPLFISISNILGIQTMLTFNHKKAFSTILITASVTNVVITIITVPFYQHIGTAFSVLFSEFLVTVLMYTYLQKQGIKILEGKYYYV